MKAVLPTAAAGAAPTLAPSTAAAGKLPPVECCRRLGFDQRHIKL